MGVTVFEIRCSSILSSSFLRARNVFKHAIEAYLILTAWAIALVTNPGLLKTMIMSEMQLQRICLESNLYKTPELNDVLYCNFKGFSGIGGLERYTALQALFLEGNSLYSLSGLPFCNLSCL